MPITHHVRAVEGASVSMVDPEGRSLRGRFAGRDADGAPRPDGEVLHDCTHYRRAIARGELALVVAPAEKPARSKGGAS